MLLHVLRMVLSVRNHALTHVVMVVVELEVIHDGLLEVRTEGETQTLVGDVLLADS